MESRASITKLPYPTISFTFCDRTSITPLFVQRDDQVTGLIHLLSLALRLLILIRPIRKFYMPFAVLICRFST